MKTKTDPAFQHQLLAEAHQWRKSVGEAGKPPTQFVFAGICMAIHRRGRFTVSLGSLQLRARTGEQGHLRALYCLDSDSGITVLCRELYFVGGDYSAIITTIITLARFLLGEPHGITVPLPDLGLR